MPRDPHSPTLAQVVHRAVEACELGEVNDRLDDLLERLEDADEPIASVADIEGRIDEAVGVLDADEQDPALAMARAVVVYLAYRREEIDADAAALLRLAARAELDGDPPTAVVDWLSGAGIRA